MPIIRQDPTTKEWVIIAGERVRRPHEFKTPSIGRSRSGDSGLCPFCPGHEASTPEEVFRIAASQGTGWAIRATAFGGGVAELLSRYLPMLRSLGISADWRLIHSQPEFFTVTKAFHNALQGGHYALGGGRAETLSRGERTERGGAGRRI